MGFVWQGRTLLCKPRQGRTLLCKPQQGAGLWQQSIHYFVTQLPAHQGFTMGRRAAADVPNPSYQSGRQKLHSVL